MIMFMLGSRGVINICYSQAEVVIQNLSKPLWMEWPFGFIDEARYTILLSLWVDVVSILLEPLSILSSLLKVKFSCVDYLSEVNFAFNSLDNFSLCIKLANCSFNSLFVLFCDEVALVHQDHISKLNLLIE